MADVTGIQWRINFLQDVVGTVNEFVSRLTGPSSSKEVVCKWGLCMDAIEVTESAYAAVMGKSPSSIGPQMPVTLVSYNDAKAFCEKKGKRLPTGDEWQKFAGTNQYATHDGKLVNDKNEKEANFDSSGPKNVASYLPNSNGMYDMTGNVWEWVSDGYHFRDLCGGCWEDVTRLNLGVAVRDRYDPGRSRYNVGFRCVVAPKNFQK